MKRNLFKLITMFCLVASFILINSRRAEAQVLYGTNYAGNTVFGDYEINDWFVNDITDPGDPLAVDGNLYIRAGSTFENLNGPLYVFGNLIIENNATFINKSDLYVYGNIINNATIIDGNVTGTLHLVGGNGDTYNQAPFSNYALDNTGVPKKQTISGTEPLITGNLVINNTGGAGAAGDIELQQTLVVNDTATFTQGIVTTPNLSANPLVFSAGSANPVTANDQSHVNGVVRSLWTSGSFTYPVGDGTAYEKTIANISANTSGLDVQYIPADAGAGNFTTGGTAGAELLQAYATQEYWNVTTSGATAAFTLYSDAYRPQNMGVASDLRVAHKLGGNWLNEGTSGTGSSTADWQVTSNPVTFTSGTSILGLGTINKNQTPLPVTIVNFTAKKQNDKDAQLVWDVAQELRLKGYKVMRSCDNNLWTEIGYVNATGSSRYQYIDHNVPCDKAYYRLEMEDLDGKTNISKVVSVVFGDTKQPITVYPNPVIDQFTINIGAGNAGAYKISMYSASGQILMVDQRNVTASEQKILMQRPFNIAQGTYILIIQNTTTNEKYITKLFFK